MPRSRVLIAIVALMTASLAVGAVRLSEHVARANDADPWFGPDKKLHFGASAGLALAGYGTAALVTPRETPRLLTGGIVALTAGVAKEIRDSQTGGDASFRDLTWDLVGTASGLLVAWVIDRLVHLAMAAPSSAGAS